MGSSSEVSDITKNTLTNGLASAISMAANILWADLFHFIAPLNYCDVVVVDKRGNLLPVKQGFRIQTL